MENIHKNEKEINTVLRELGYKNDGLVGCGAFAKVYRIQKENEGYQGACKISREFHLLRKESLILQQVNHSLFPQYCDYKEAGEYGFLFMEYVPGMNLRRLVEMQGAIHQDRAIQIARSLAEGLCYLHERRTPIFFRDLKPDNVIIREDGRVKLVDFGSACIEEEDRNIITGTEGFGAPEQWLKAGNIGSYSDVYALGKLLGFMLGTEKVEWWLRDLLEECVRRQIRERIPDMRCFLSRLKKGKRNFRRRADREFLYHQIVIVK